MALHCADQESITFPGQCCGGGLRVEQLYRGTSIRITPAIYCFSLRRLNFQARQKEPVTMSLPGALLQAGGIFVPRGSTVVPG